MAFQEMGFIINGISHLDIGIDGFHLVRVDSETVGRSMMGSKSIQEEKVFKRDVPYFLGIEKSPIEFELQFSLLDYEYAQERLLEIGKLFGKDKYVTFESTDYPEVVFYVIITDMELTTVSNSKGWVTMYLRTSAPYGFTKKETTTFNLTSLTTPQTIVLKNLSNVMHPKYNDYIYEPEVKVVLSGGNTGFTFTNTTNANDVFGFTGLVANETITIYNDKRKILSSTGQPRISNLINKNWFKLVSGNNHISINKPMTLTVTEEYPIYI